MEYIYIYKYISQIAAICSLWTVCPCLYHESLYKNGHNFFDR